MRINPRYYPAIILVTFVVFLLLGFMLGFLPEHGGNASEHSFLMLMETMA